MEERTMKLSKKIPARTKTLTAKWLKKDFLVMSDGYRKIRARTRQKAMDKCFWCKRGIENGEMMALACFDSTGNKILCQKCATELETG